MHVVEGRKCDNGYISQRFSSYINYRIATTTIRNGDDYNKVSATELDSHADSPVVGRFAKILEHTDKEVNVSGFSKSLGKPLTAPIVNAAVMYDCDVTGNSYVLIICNALYVRDMEVNLIPPIMMRLAGIKINECPKFLADKPTVENHSAYFPDADIRIPFLLEGIISYIPTRIPTKEELSKNEGNYLLLTPNTPEWNPHTNIYSEQEYGMVDYNGNIKNNMENNKFVERSIFSTRNEETINEIIFDSREDPIACSHHLVSSVSKMDYDQTMREGDSVSGEFMIDSIKSDRRRSKLTPTILANRLNIPIEMARRTLSTTTQNALRSTDNPSLSRKYRTNDKMLRYPRVYTKVFMDTMFASTKSTKSIRGFTSCQVFATEFGHVFTVLMSSKSGKEVSLAIKRYFKEIGVPEKLICDQAREQVKGDSKILCHDAGCTVVELEKGTPSSNRAERAIKTLKDETKNDLFQSNCPMVLWDYALERRAKIICSTPRSNYLLDGSTPHTKLTGQIADISNLIDFGWYDWVIYRVEGQKFPFQHQKLGRCLGPATHAGNTMSQWVLTRTGDVMPIQTLRRLTESERNNKSMIDRMNEFDVEIKNKFGDSIIPPPATENQSPNVNDDDVVYSEPYEDWYEEDQTQESVEIDEINGLEMFLDAEVMLPKDGVHMQAARVVGRSKDSNGKTIGLFNSNPILNTQVYNVMFPDGSIKQYGANIIAENIFSQVDEHGYRYQLLRNIVNHKRDETAITKDEGYVTSKNGNRIKRHTTKGWYFEVEWADGTSSWVKLKDLKADNPIELAEYCVLKELLDEPAISWWAPYVIKKKQQIISKVKSRTKKKSQKYGIKIPKSVAEALEIDRSTNTTFWKDAINKEMKNVRVAFDVLDDERKLEPGRVYLECYMIFDVKMDFTRKARFVANGSRTPDLENTYAGVVSRETVRIAFVYAALNELDVIAGDIQNAYLTAPSSEKYWTICGPEFGPELQGSKALIVRALYGTKCAGRDFRNHLRACMELLNYQPCLADPDLWMRDGIRNDGKEYYEYVLLYVDDCLVIGENAKSQIAEIDKYFPMKPSSIGPPTIYLGAKIGTTVLDNGIKSFYFSMNQYIKEAIRNVETYLNQRNLALLKSTTIPITMNYTPEIDMSPELDESSSAYYQSLIGILRWIVEMGRIDIITEVSMLSSFVAMPREGHLNQVLHIFAYLKTHVNARLMLDPSYPEINDAEFEKNGDWTSYYGDEKDLPPINAPKSKAKEFIIRAYVDASHACCKITRRSRTGFIVYLNKAPIYWHSKKQGSCEISTFGSEFVAMRQCCDYIRGLRYKLRMMGIPVNNPALLYGDNQSVLWNTSVPDSTLKKKSAAVAYNYCREGVSRNEWVTNYVPSIENPSDIMTKSVVQHRKEKIRMMLYDIYDYDNKRV